MTKAAPPPAPETAKLGRYEVVRPLARGGMAEVFLARAQGVHGIQKLVAIKRILPSYAQERQFINMLVDEARISMLMSHPNVATMLEFGEQNGDYFLVMEYVAGQSLSRVMRAIAAGGERMDPLVACFVVVEMLQGLDAAHNQKDERGKPAQIIHRDVSPQNVLISFDGMVKLIDFGIARAERRLEKTSAGTIKGKLRYLAPEMISPARFGERDGFDHRVDVFAAGVVLFEMLSLRKLFTGDNELDVYKSILEDAAPNLAEAGIVDDALMAIVTRALAKRAQDRYPSAEAFADDLRAYIYRRDPSFTGKRVQQMMEKWFAKLKAEVDQLDGAPPLADFEGPREVTLLGGVRASPRGSVEPGPQTVATPSRAARAGLKTALAEQGHVGAADALTQAVDLSGFPSLNPDGASEQTAAAEVSKGAGTVATGQTKLVAGGHSSVGTASGASMTSIPPAELTHEHTPPTSTDLIKVQAGLQRQGRVLFFVGAVLFGVLLAGFAVLAIELASASGRGDTVLDVVGDDARLPVLIATTPAGATVTIAGEELAPVTTPAVLMRAPGERFDIQVDLDGYEPIRRTIQMADAGENAKVELTLQGVPVSLHIELTPQDAALSVDGTPYTPGMKVLPGRDIVLRATATPDAPPEKKTVQAAAGAPFRLTWKLQFDATSAEGVKTAPPPASQTKKAPKRTTRTSKSGRDTRAAARTGTLKVTSAPWWGEVVVDGEPLDETTPVRAKLSVGSHKVVVRHPPKGIKKSFTVTIKAGKTTKRHVQFE